MFPREDLWLGCCRRTFLRSAGLSLGGLALSQLLAEAGGAARKPHFPAKAKRVIYLHMIGAPSQLDLFDHKPALSKQDGKPCPDDLLKGKRFAFIGGKMTLAGSRFRFAKHGQSGQEISELLPGV